MLIREMSDLHLEFGPLDVPVITNEKEITLVLAGDIGLAKRKNTIIPFLEEMSERHERVIMVLGNHEHYRCSTERSLYKICDALPDSVNNVWVIENEMVVDEKNNVAFIGGTLWTDCNKNNPLTVFELERPGGMNDFQLIRTGLPSAPYARPFKAHDAMEYHRKSVEYIFKAVEKQKQLKRNVVVVSHHAPSTKSIAECYDSGFHMNGGYASSLEEQMLDTCPDVWFHGHTHSSFDYFIGDTNVICNPRGYTPDALNPYFDPCKLIEI